MAEVTIAHRDAPACIMGRQPQDPDMPHARPEWTIVAAVIGLLLAIGVPALHRGDRIEGWICIGLAALVVARVLMSLLRLRK